MGTCAYRANYLFYLFIFLFLFLRGAFGLDAEQPAEKLEITSDKLILDSESRYAEFSGNVFAKQGDIEITANHLKIHYKDNGASPNPASPGEEAINQIIFEGDVVIQFEDKTATSQGAIYTAEDRKFTLTGPVSSVMLGKDSISGSTIVIDRDTGMVEFDKPVKAVLYPDDSSRKNNGGMGRKESGTD